MSAVDLCRPCCRSDATDSDDDDDTLTCIHEDAIRPADAAFRSVGFHEVHGRRRHGPAFREVHGTWPPRDDDISGDDIAWAETLDSARYDTGFPHVSHMLRPGKENRAKVPACSYRLSIAWQQHSGPIRRHSGTSAGPSRWDSGSSAGPSRRNSGLFSGPLTGAPKTCLAPSIIPPVLRKKNLNFQACEPLSPKVTCLGKVRMKEIVFVDVSKASDGSVVLQSSHFDNKGQTWDKVGKGRKKKQVCDKIGCLSRMRRYDAKVVSESTIMPAEWLQSRRERAASLASSLTGLIEDLRRVEKDDGGYVPTVPPPNSLLIMRGCRKMEDTIQHCHDDMSVDDDNESVDFSNALHDLHLCCKAIASKVRSSLAELIDAEVNGIHEDDVDIMFQDDDDDKDNVEDDDCQHGTEATHERSCLSEKETNATAEAEALVEGKEFPARSTIWERRAMARLRDIEVKKHV